MRDYCVYRYTLVESGEVIYIGKTDASLKARIDAHEREEKFQPYRGSWKIDFVRLSNRVETDVVERYLINFYKPVINEKDVEEGVSTVSISIPAWEPYENYVDPKERRASVISNAKKRAEADLTLLYDAMGHTNGKFVSKELHPTGRLPMVRGYMQVTGMDVQLTGEYYAQTVTAPEALEANFHRLEDGIYRTVYKEEHGDTPFDELWDFVERLKSFKADGYYESELSDMLEMRNVPESLVSSGYFDCFISSMFQHNDRCHLEIDPGGYERLEEVEERIAAGECSFIKKDAGILFEREDF